MRYTECRLEKIADELLADIDKETVDFVPNYDGKEQEPAVLPSRIPNLLVNGSSGIAVGMATNIPPHNLAETINACLALLANPETTDRGADGAGARRRISPPPESSTALEGVREGYRTGRGRVVMRARTHVEDLEKGSRQAIIVDEMPYQVNKANLLDPHRRAGAREEARGHLRPARRVRQVRHARGDRAEARRSRRRSS